jgi:predicted small lipoprotein YifL
MKHRLILATTLAAMTLCSCGQKGPLMLPADPAAQPPAKRQPAEVPKAPQTVTPGSDTTPADPQKK